MRRTARVAPRELRDLGNPRTGKLEVLVPVRTVNEGNRSRHEHWATKKKRIDAQHDAVRLCLMARSTCAPWLPPLRVTLTRLSPGEVDQGSEGSVLKHVQDAVAHWIGVDDGRRDLVQYVYRQEKAPRGSFGVRIAVEPLPLPVAVAPS